MYNIAYKYLKEKYGKKCGLTLHKESELRTASNKNKRAEIENNLIDSDYIYYIDDKLINNHDDKELYLLMVQSQISITVKKELENKLFLMSII